ncbi:Calycin [Pleurostoma richardsiae]|uniref:Calycin n=1 Tax=Pleurostoma richardsiae TaxID=41990 RepID=A0AA38RHI7_9PEZI|nr:Calycin [Pleurostoma richardsiae]
MAAPAEITLDNLSGRWSMNLALSDPYDLILKAQGVNWLTRKVLTVGTFTLTIQETVDEAGLTHLVIDTKPGSGLPGTTERRVLNDEPSELTHPLFGKIRGRTKWLAPAELPSEWLGAGFEDGTVKTMLMTTDHLDIDAITYQAGAFQVIKEERRYVRNVEVQRGDESQRVKLVYDYLGPLEA